MKIIAKIKNFLFENVVTLSCMVTMLLFMCLIYFMFVMYLNELVIVSYQPKFIIDSQKIDMFSYFMFALLFFYMCTSYYCMYKFYECIWIKIQRKMNISNEKEKKVSIKDK